MVGGCDEEGGGLLEGEGGPGDAAEGNGHDEGEEGGGVEQDPGKAQLEQGGKGLAGGFGWVAGDEQVDGCDGAGDAEVEVAALSVRAPPMMGLRLSRLRNEGESLAYKSPNFAPKLMCKTVR